MFNLEELDKVNYRKGFTDIVQFDEKCPLNPLVDSDHMELILETSFGLISSWNISNPAHHHYFGSFETASFAKTHMVGESEKFIQKIEDQLEYISDNMDDIPVQIIIEGYHTFYQQLEDLLIIKGKNFALIYDPEVEDPINITGILINENYLSVIKSDIYRHTYIEEGDRITQYLEEKRENTARIPVVQLTNSNNEILIVMGVHIRGSNSRFPVSGIEYYNNVFTGLIIEYSESSVIMMGDWNSLPSNTSQIIKNGRLMITDYPTHINPGNTVSFYDHGYVHRLPGSRFLSPSKLSVYSQALLDSIIRSRKCFLKENF